MKKTALVVILLLAGGRLFSLSPTQTLVERILNENRYFLEFINTSVSNFGTQNNIKQLKDANQKHFNANLWYLQSEYSKAYKEIRGSQEILRDLYLDLLENRYIEDTQTLLNISAPVIIQSKDKKAELFLRLGYRDLASSHQYRKVGYNYNKFLYSNKIRYFIDGIKRARRAKRYAFLALIESKTPLEEKEDYKKQTLDEALNPEHRFERQTDYERIRNTLTNRINRQLIENTHNFFLHHADNYGFVGQGKDPILENSVDELTTDQVTGKVSPQSNEKEDNKKPGDETNKPGEDMMEDPNKPN